MDATTPAAGEQPEDDSEDIESKIANLPADEASNRLRRRLLLAHFWRSAWAFLAAHRNDPAHCLALSCSILWHERLEPGDLRCARASRRRDGSLSVVDLRSLASSQRHRDAAPGLCPHDHAAPLALLAEQSSSRPLAEERALLSA